MMFDMLEYYNMLREKNVNIIYSGPVWADGIEEIGNTLRKRLALDERPLSFSQSVFSVFVEQMNNMIMYSSEKEHFDTENKKHFDISTGVFILGVQGRSYFLQSGNIMEQDNIDFMKERIDYLNTLDKVQLRKFYKEQIKLENGNLQSKGAGLGLIEIARRASSKIEYSFTPLEGKQSFFAMYVEIG